MYGLALDDLGMKVDQQIKMLAIYQSFKYLVNKFHKHIVQFSSS